MKKSVGVTLVVFVALGSLLLRFWLTSPAAAPVPTPLLQFRPVAQGFAAASLPGQPLLAGQAGRVHEVYTHEGQRVRKGQLLYKLLEKLPSVPQQQLRARLVRQEQAYAALQVAQPAAPAPVLRTAHRQLTETRRQLARLVPMLSFVYVTAPAEGLIKRPSAHPGDLLTAQTPVATLVTDAPADTTLLLTSVE
ncbi:biotin/lipoyl-binding protein [Hymenobacter sp. NST-14]|uniref:biotin/lipoyl-binding protein n=1 Tax=Hymenobacter piscis TaxID=2839984 RepID=UPI001C026787|nr:biotin/lipoyl-binding protein [Hymenobacter piscis]MBT9392945.1 biotin/lipoyl-binding protein [Hymenobacter piscis]